VVDSERGNKFTPDQSEIAPAHMYPQHVEEQIKLVVEDALRLQDFIAQHPIPMNNIYNNLEQAERLLPKAASDHVRTSIFRAEGLSIAHSLATVGSTQENYKSAISFLEQNFPGRTVPQLRDELNSHILLYVAEKGYQARSEDPKKGEIWESIKGYLNEALQSKGKNYQENKTQIPNKSPFRRVRPFSPRPRSHKKKID
jgi:hypothetical protein